MEAVEIAAWCKRHQLDHAHAVVLSGVYDVTDDVLLDDSSVKVLGKIKIVDRHPDLTSKTDFVLVRTLANATEQILPDSVGVPGEVGPWPVHILPVNTALINAISSLVDKCNSAPADTQSYSKLRMFSGVRPTPSGEEEYDAWAEQTTHMLEEWQCSDSIKKQRIVESLKGSAADIRFLRAQTPNATANDYMQVLKTFRHTFQSEGERLSTYLLRPDKLLHCIFRKRGLQLADINQLRIEQVIRCSLPHDMIAMRIHITYKLRPPPSFHDLLKEVGEEENITHLRGETTGQWDSVCRRPVFLGW
uniref:Paraneoplastic antigen Ma-like C-terminal domain-containing protein n=1 Tax=Monopterus albus TaxID=43700 RepID=A0A3Q3QTV7_MONAL